MDDAQRTAFDAEFDAAWRWHRQTQLPLYAADLRRYAASLTQGNPDRTLVEDVAHALEGHGEALGAELMPRLARLLALLDDAQVQKLLATRRREIDKDFRKHEGETPEARRERAIDDAAEGFEPWIGALLETQRALLDRSIEAAQARGEFDPAAAHAAALHDLDGFAGVLASRGEPGLESRLRALGEPADAAARTRLADAQARGRAFFTDFAATLDGRQRDRLRRRLLEYAADCEALAARR